MSEHTLDLLIDRLKNEAIEQAEKEATTIVAEAQAKAQKLLAEAEEEKRSVLQDAQKEAQAIVENGKSALQVAARDLSLSVQQDLLQLLKETLEEEVQQSFSPDLMKSVLANVVSHFGDDLEFQLPPEHAEELAEYVRQQLQASGHSISVMEKPGASSGITILKKDQGWSYTISPAQVTEALLPQLNAKWVQILTDKPKV